MAFALDIAAAVVLLLCAAVGFARGFVRYIIKMLGTVVCVILAFVCSSLAARPVYEKFAAPMIQSELEEHLGDFDVTSAMDGAIRDLGYDIEIPYDVLRNSLTDRESIPQSVVRAAQSHGVDEEMCQRLQNDLDKFFTEDLGENICKMAGIEDKDGLAERINFTSSQGFDIIRAFASEGGTQAGIKYVVEKVVDRFMVTFIRSVLFVLIFIAAESVLAIIFVISGIFDKLPAVNGMNRVLGALMGLVKGIMYIALAAALLVNLESAFASGGVSMDISFADESVIFGAACGLLRKLTG